MLICSYELWLIKWKSKKWNVLSRLNINQLDCQNIDRQGLRRKVQQQVDPPQQQRTPWTFWGGKTEVQVIIIITRPKPAYGRQGWEGSWGQDTDEVNTFLGVFNVSLRACGAQLGFNQPGTINHGNRPKTMKPPWKTIATNQKPWKTMKPPWKTIVTNQKPWNHL